MFDSTTIIDLDVRRLNLGPSMPHSWIERFNDPTKLSDQEQAKAFSAELLARPMESAIRSHLDLCAYERALAFQNDVRMRLRECSQF